MPIIDLTHTISHGMPVFPGESSPSLIQDDLPENTGYITFRLESNMHTGTHMDAPLHARSGDRTIESYSVDTFFGIAVVIDVRSLRLVRMQTGWEEIFKQFPVILFCTGHNALWGTDKYYLDYPVFENDIALALKKNKVRIAGFDSPSPDKSPFNFHNYFLNGERFMIENLTGLENLLGIREFEFMAFPLKIHAEASLIRAVARY
jgi:arylformamidase